MKEDEVWVNVVGEIEVVIESEGALDGNTRGVGGGSVDTVDADTIATEVGVITDVDWTVEGDKVERRLKVSVNTEDSVLGGGRYDVGVTTSLVTVEGLSGVGVADNEGESDGADISRTRGVA